MFCREECRAQPIWPLNVIRKVTLLDSEKEELNFSALAGFMQRIGLSPERYLEGLLEE